MLNKKRGFTLIELLLVVGITFILVSASIPIYGNLQSSSQLNETSSQIIQDIRIARERSVARYNNSSHGIKFQLNSYTLYQGVAYLARDAAYDREVVLDEALSISTTLTGDEINFSKGLGEPDNIGFVNLSHSVDGLRTININSYGMVEEQ